MSGNFDCAAPVERTFPAYAVVGMEDAAVDVVVIQWIMQKLNVDRMKRIIQYITSKPSSDELS